MAGAGVSATTSPERWIVWECSGKPIVVRLRPDVVGRLSMAVREGFKALPRRGLEIGGLLLGSKSESDGRTLVEIDDFEAVESEHATGPSYLLSEADRGALKARIVAHRGGGKLCAVVGFFRSNTRATFAITEEDAYVYSAYFKNPSDVFLLINREESGAPTGGFIIREGGKVLSRTPYAQFAVEGPVIWQAEASLPQPAAAPVTRTIDVPALLRTAREVGLPVRLAIAGVLVVAVGLLLAISRRAPGSVPVKSALPALSVASAGNGLRLSWERKVAAGARSAVLTIQDGPESHRVDLDAKQLREGAVVYWPKHSDVEFRLEVLSPGANVIESVRAIGGPSEATVANAVQAPAAPPAMPALPDIPPQVPQEPRALRVSTRRAPRRGGVQMASRAIPAILVYRAETAPAAVSLPEPPPVQSAMVPASADGNLLLKVVAPTSTLSSAALPVHVTVEPLALSHRNLPLVGKRNRRADYVPPAALHDPGVLGPLPRVNRSVNIDVKVYVSPSGKVQYSEALSKVVDANRELAALAVFSARRWEFVPARSKDGPVPGEAIIHYQFGPWLRASAADGQR